MVENFPVELFQKVFCDVGTVWSGIVMRPCPPLSWTSVRPSLNFLHHSRTLPSLIKFSPYTLLILRRISAALRPSFCRKRITLRNSHLAGASIVAAMFTCPYLGYDWRIGGDKGRGCCGGTAQSRDAQIWLPRISYFFRSTIGGCKKKNSPRITPFARIKLGYEVRGVDIKTEARPGII